MKNNFHCLKKLLSYANVDVNCKDDSGKSLLVQTINELSPTNIEHINLLLTEKNADPNVADTKNQAALYYACQLNATRLANSHQNLNDYPEEEKKEIISEYQKLKIDLVKMLLKAKADINQRNVNGKVP
eukprot:CAMPEP_0114596900 /NCGR_PEP_ID=MMETSP0125-20121206/19095_1 /TAXON_ID=485358 ORGANISM="Aristerostoma sp., Strain ATCC 50986" /NCGR_SAMPLE_ID=MMETSP0125 /ASSEMBLY_ACC=CAM_ASM_000245 /LENGTH=128 /DNA_ID=CAMNT_0001800743 /DNA_START=1074 /DNA_END=1456 /DNA_ORIENTATION=+